MSIYIAVSQGVGKGDFIMSLCQEIISSLGLLFDIVGALFIWRYGIKVFKKKEEEGVISIRLEDWRIVVGMTLLILGFLLQIISNWLP